MARRNDGCRMTNPIDNGELIHFLYRAVDEPGALEEFMRRFKTSYNSHFGFLSIRDSADLRVLDVYQWGFGEVGMKAYMDYYYQHDVWSNALISLAQSTFHASHEIYPDDDYLKTEGYNDFAKPMSLRHGIGVKFLVPQSSHYVQFSGARRPDQGYYDRAIVTQMDQLVPHLKQFMHLRTRFGDLQGRAACMEQALSRMGTAVFVCTQDGKILFQTDQAERLLQDRSAVLAPKGSLCVQQSQANTDLKNLIQNAVAASRGENRTPGGALRVEDADGVLEVLVTPVRYAPPGGVLDSSSPCAAVFMRDVDAPRMVAPEFLSVLYNLSAAEADIAIRMSQGVSIAHIADARGVSVQTVRTQTKALYQKTETGGQADLVALVSTSLAGMASMSRN